MLSRRVGLRHLELVEDAVQSALLAAVETWPGGGVPDNPSAWLFTAAERRLLDELRTRARRERIALQQAQAQRLSMHQPLAAAPGGDEPEEVVRMLFACCDDAIPRESQWVLALKTICGFEVREIAERLFVSEASVYKRLVRAYETLRALPFELNDLSPAHMSARLPAVLAILYAAFTEGHLSSHASHAIRRELCDEARRLTELVAAHPLTATPETFALLALMHLHLARLPARQDASGGLLLLEEQDRSRWDQRAVALGLMWLAKSAQGESFSSYHAEAGIAAEHCLSPSFKETRWDRIVDGYILLERLAPSALHTLNRALATAELRGPVEGLRVLEGLEPPSWLAGSYLWAAALADLHRRCGHEDVALRYRATALASAPSDAVRSALARRLGS